MNPKTLNQISKHIAVCAQCNQSYFEVAAKNLPQTLFSAINKVTYWSCETSSGSCISSSCLSLSADTVKYSSSVMAAEEADVLVIGGGPVGLTMAVELSYRGIKNILVEKKPTTSALAKAIHVTARTMEQYRRLGLQATIEEASYPRDQKISFDILQLPQDPRCLK